MKKDLKSMKLPMSEKVTYGFGNLAATLMFTTAGSFITYYYTDVVGLSAAIVGNILLWARVFDGISDLIMGTIVDKMANKKGKARPWIIRMAVPYAFALILLFSSPDFLEGTGKAVYAFVTYVIAMAGVYTATMVPYNTMLSTPTTNPVERGTLSTSRTICGYAGATIVNAIVWPLVTFYGNDKPAWTMTAATLGFAATVLLIIMFCNSAERVIDREEKKEKVKIPVLVQVKNLVKNKYWLIIILYMLTNFINFGLNGINVYYANWILGDGNKVGVIGSATYASIMVGALLMPTLMKKFPKRTLCMCGSAVYITGILILALFSDNFYMMILGVAVKGLGCAPGAVSGYAMLGDIVDYGQWKTKIRNEGMVFSAATFGEKVGSGLGGLILGTVLSIGGYVSTATVQSASALLSIKAVFIYVPLVFSVIGLILLCFYNLDKKMPEIRKQMQ